ncbi:MAG: hypothetical protein MCS20_02075, partial [Candidatus Phytoplasma mali]|nr:hypothetical protein [Candidatus Phytoplasma mali]
MVANESVGVPMLVAATTAIATYKYKYIYIYIYIYFEVQHELSCCEKPGELNGCACIPSHLIA